MQLHGVHHVTAVTARVKENAQFYTQTLGLRLVKKSVNQDDVSAYHLFYADALGTPGTDMTFFDWPDIGPNSRGTDSISGTMFRVNGRDALVYWVARFAELNVTHEPIASYAGRDVVAFEDAEGQRMMLVDDGGTAFEGEVWTGAGIPEAYGIRGFYATALTVPDVDYMHAVLTQLLNMEETDRFTNAAGDVVVVFSMDGGGPGKEVHVTQQAGTRVARLGAGGVHHVAFRVPDFAAQQAWHELLTQARVPVSGLIDRYYFRSIYFRVSNGILFEVATDGPGFATDEPLETLGERLALPPFLEPQRAEIEANLKPIV